MNYKTKWETEAARVAEGIKLMPGKLVGVGVDDGVKADFFIKYWAENCPHLEVVKTVHSEIFSLIQIKLKDTRSND